MHDPTDALSKAVQAHPAIDPGLLQAACLNLSTRPDELEPLLDLICARRVPPQRISHLIEQTWTRLQGLRAREAEWVSRTATHSDLAHPLQHAFIALRPGIAFSLENANAAFESAYRAAPAAGEAAERVAAIRAAQAEIAAIQLDYRRAAERYADADATPGLAESAQWDYALQHACALDCQGREFRDDAALQATIDLCETRLLALAPRTTRPDAWATTHHHLGDALGALGQRQRGTSLLDRAIAAFAHALSARSRERAPRDWAATQSSLGTTLGVLGQRRGDADMLERAVDALQSALDVLDRDHWPRDWAMTQNTLAAALLSLGQRKRDRTLLKRAAEAYKDLLQIWTRARSPLDWAATMDNLGTALRLLGEHRKGPRTFEQAVAACRSALAERTRGRVPDDWAMTQNNLGAALHKLGERENDPHALEAAIRAYEEALEVGHRDRAPLPWAMTRANLGAARKALAQCVGDVGMARWALADFAAVAQVFRDASHAQYYELVTEQLALTQKLEYALTRDASGRDKPDSRPAA
ncbi:MAG: tetratricopeptide repeat protein [Gammaproteobacteria bacterium]